MNNEEIMTQLILHGGNARGLAYEALDEAEEFRFEEAESKLDEANDEFLEAHKHQTSLIRSQDESAPTFMMIHAQDHVMTAQAEMQLIKRMIDQLKEMEQVQQRLAKLEG